ncbi:hypothetical protein BCR42DRAFT_430617, partial [Absidia repens]
MNPSDFPPLNSQGNNSKQGTSLESSWAEVAKEPPHCSPPPDQPVTSPLKPSYADTAGHEAHLLETSPTPAEQSTGRLSNEDASAPTIPPPPPNASFAKMAAKSPPPEPTPLVEEDVPSLEEKEATESSKPLSIYDEDNTGTNNTSSSLSSQISEPTGQSYVQVASQDLDQAPPPAQARVDSQPLFDENHMMTESARRETRRMKQMENSGQVDALHDNGYSWLTSLATAVLLHLRYSPFTSPYRFPFIYRSITDIATLPIYTKPLQPTLSCLPILQQQSRQQLDQSISDHGCSQNDVT